jgi:alpha-glucosidase
MLARFHFAIRAAVLGLSALPLAALPAPGQQSGENLRHTPSGIEQTANGVTLNVEALRPDVLRVRIYPTGHDSEDVTGPGSWAVLPESRAARVPVTPEADGFRTSSLRVTVTADQRLTVADLTGNILSEDSTPPTLHGKAFRINKIKSNEDHFFGLGDKPGPLDRAGEAFAMWNTDSYGWQESTDPIYKSIPFFIQMRQGRALGVFLDNTWRTFFDFGRELPDQTAFSTPNGPLDYYLLYGPDPKAVLRAWAWLTGPTPLPPLWALGFQQSRYSYMSRKETEEVAARLRADRIPADALWLDIDFQYKNRPFTVDPDRFPDFPGLVHELSGENFHLITITDLHIPYLPGQNYAPYETGKAGDNFVKRNGQDYIGPVWPGPSVFPDFTRQQTRAWWGTLYKDFAADGVSGFWNDMNEPAVFVYPGKTMPLDATHRIDEPGFSPRTALHAEIHNIYGMENSRATHDGILALRPNERPFVMTRASFAGGQRYAVTWTGDNSSTWNHLRQTTPQLLNLGLSGFSLAGADVGGFAGSPSPDLLTRWLVLAAFQPIDRDHAVKGSRPHEPWADGPEHEAIRRRYIEERYKLMPYLYTATEETSRDGIPIIRPLFVEFPHATADNHPLDLDAPGEFMFGPDILVADSPSPEEVAPYEVHLPPGLWYSYWTGSAIDRRAPIAARDQEIHDNNAQAATLPPVMVEPKLDELPIYVRAGAIVPMQPVTESTSETPNGPLTLRVYTPASGAPASGVPASGAPASGVPASAGDTCTGSLYLDDGHSYNFTRGDYFRQHFTCSIAADGSLQVEIEKPEGSFAPWWKEIRVEAVGFAPQSSGVQGVIENHSVAAERTTLGWAVSIPASAGASRLTLSSSSPAH